ncbi:MAG: hypothetical protein CL943_00730 [Candidatus Diapherotrites archaeon]|uniref:Protein kinase domain-containing protein n=1 Tax=Candidatus Iainarchaeum sp. TaxID=3101447 RepID=A0A2D6M062_9ARCH|nr:hypothetical protein [Candidatus Diapherotrites archaeon]
MFERTGFGLDSLEGQKIFSKDPLGFMLRIEELVGKMHSLGITHNHLHGGNIALTRKGQIVLLDLSAARMAKIPKKPTKKWIVKKFHNELWTVANSLAYLIEHIKGAEALRGNLFSLREAIVGNIVSQYSGELKKKLDWNTILALRKM